MYSFEELPTHVRDNLLARFEGQTNGHKIKRGGSFFLPQPLPIKRSYQPRQLPSAYQLKNSLIKIGGEVYRIGQGCQAVMGQGSFGKVKVAQNLKTGQMYALKIEHLSDNNYSAKDSNEEDKKLFDVNIGIAHAKRRNRHQTQKNYSLMHHMGTPLDKILDNPIHYKLQDSERFDLAINLCMEVFKLHNGILSNSGTTYAHRDIKPQNITVKNRVDLSLVDFGISKVDPSKTNHELAGAPIYMPMRDRYFKRERKISQEQVDVFAIKRTLYMPNTLQCFNGLKIDSTRKNHGFCHILPMRLLNNSPLFPYIDTSGSTDDQANSNHSAITLAALIVLEKYGASKHCYQAVSENQNLAKIIMAVYYLEKEQRMSNVGQLLNTLIAFYVDGQRPPTNQLLNTIISNAKNLKVLINFGQKEKLQEASENASLMTLLKGEAKQSVKKGALVLFNLGCLHSRAITLLERTPKLAELILRKCHSNDNEVLIDVFQSPTALELIERLENEKKNPLFIFPLAKDRALLTLVSQASQAASDAIFALYEHNKEQAPTLLRKIILQTEGNDCVHEHLKRAEAINVLNNLEKQELYEFALREDNYLAINHLKTLLEHSTDLTLKKYLLANLVSLTNEPHYLTLIKEHQSVLNLEIITLLFKGNAYNPQGKQAVNEILADEYLSQRFYLLLNSTATSRTLIKSILEDHVKFKVFKKLAELKLSTEYHHKVLTSISLSNKVYSHLIHLHSSDELLNLIREDKDRQKPRQYQARPKESVYDRQTREEHYRDLRKQNWPKEKAHQPPSFARNVQERFKPIAPLSQKTRARRDLAMYHSRYNPITHQPLQNTRGVERHDPLPILPRLGGQYP